MFTVGFRNQNVIVEIAAHARQNFPLVLPMYTVLYAKGVTGRKEVLPMYINPCKIDVCIAVLVAI